MVTSLPDEIWKDIPRFEGIYQASNLGRVKSIDRIFYAGKKHLTKCSRKEMLMYRKPDYTGFPKLRTNKNGKRGILNVSRVVAILFVPNPFGKKEAKNIDGNKLNMAASNLVWATSSEKAKHAYDIGLKNRPIGGLNKNAKIVLDTQTGVFYDCAKDACISKGLSYEVVSKKLRGIFKNNTGLIYA